jgi:hypothetical protein
MTNQTSWGFSYGKIPPEGPRFLDQLSMTFVGAGSSTLGLDNELNVSAEMSFIQAVYVDNNPGAGAVTLVFSGSQQRIVVPAGRQGWFNPALPEAVGDVTVTAGGAGTVRFIFANVPVAPAVWGA